MHRVIVVYYVVNFHVVVIRDAALTKQKIVNVLLLPQQLTCSQTLMHYCLMFEREKEKGASTGESSKHMKCVRHFRLLDFCLLIAHS